MGRHGHGRVAQAVLAPVPGGLGAAAPGLRSGPRQAAGRAARRVPGHERDGGVARHAVRSPKGKPFLRPERGARPAVHLSRLEVRRPRELRRHADRDGGRQLQGQDPPDVLPGPRGRRRPLGVHGAAGRSAPAARVRVHADAGGSTLLLVGRSGEQLRPGHRGRHRLRPYELPSLLAGQLLHDRGVARGRQADRVHRRRLQGARHDAEVLREGHGLRPGDRGAARDGRGLLLLAFQQLPDAVLHKPAREHRPARLRSHRRRAHDAVDAIVEPGQAVYDSRAPVDADRRRLRPPHAGLSRHAQSHPQQVERLHDRPRHTTDDELHRHPRPGRPGLVGPGADGRYHRPVGRASRHDGPGDHPHAADAAGRRDCGNMVVLPREQPWEDTALEAVRQLKY